MEFKVGDIVTNGKEFYIVNFLGDGTSLLDMLLGKSGPRVYGYQKLELTKTKEKSAFEKEFKLYFDRDDYRFKEDE